MDDQPGLNKMNGSNHNKMLHSFPHLNNGNSHLTTSQPRMSHNVNYTNSTKEISQFKE